MRRKTEEKCYWNKFLCTPTMLRRLNWLMDYTGCPKDVARNFKLVKHSRVICFAFSFTTNEKILPIVT